MEVPEIENTTQPEDIEVLLDLVELPEDSSVQRFGIYRAPQKVRQTKEAAYTPRIVSIGPFHHGNERFKLMERLKLGYLKSFLQGTGLTWEHCLSKLKEWELEIRNCYEESIPLDSDDFLKIILIDAAFIVELFLRYDDKANWIRRDRLFLKPWVLDDVTHDLTLLENQLLFFVLNGLFNLAIASASVPDDFGITFLQLTFNCFADLNLQQVQPDEVRSLLHFTDLLRIFYLPPIERLPARQNTTLEHLYSASELVNRGLLLKVERTRKSFLELKYRKGILTMPRLEIPDIAETRLRNIVAFEQHHYPHETYITDFLKFLDYFICNKEDVDVLVSRGIIVTSSKDSHEVTARINHLCTNLIQRNMNMEYLSICNQLNDFYERPASMWKLHMKRAFSILLSLSLIQTICSVISLFRS